MIAERISAMCCRGKKRVMDNLSLAVVFTIVLCSFCIAMSSPEGEYVINPGDTVSILVWGHEQYTQTVSVRPDGRISYPFLGEIRVDGLTTTELSDVIRKSLLMHLIDPQVTVAIVQPKKNEVFVLGQVKFPNQFRYEQDKITLLKALSMAGGTLDDVADLHNVKIIRNNGSAEAVDLQNLLASEPHESVLLSSGDLVYVPGKERVSVTGHVLIPGEYKTRSSLSIMQALALAGGPVHDTADLSNALIVRSTGEIVKADLGSDFWIGGAHNGMYALNPGDALYVPNAYEVEEVSVLGYVQNPGQFRVKEPITLYESLTLAGGITSLEDANLREARIIRKEGKFEQIDLSLLREPVPKDLDSIGNITLYPGDALEIHRRGKVINWSLALTVVSVLSLVYNMAYTILK